MKGNDIRNVNSVNISKFADCHGFCVNQVSHVLTNFNYHLYKKVVLLNFKKSNVFEQRICIKFEDEYIFEHY